MLINRKNVFFVFLGAVLGLVNSTNIIAGDPFPITLNAKYASEQEARKAVASEGELLACNADDAAFKYAKEHLSIPGRGLGWGPSGVAVVGNENQHCGSNYDDFPPQGYPRGPHQTQLHMGGINPSQNLDEYFCYGVDTRDPKQLGIMQRCQEIHAYSYAHYAPGAQIVKYYEHTDGSSASLKYCVIPPDSSSKTYSFMVDVGDTSHDYHFPDTGTANCCVASRIVEVIPKDEKGNYKKIGNPGYFTAGKWQCLRSGEECGIVSSANSVRTEKKIKRNTNADDVCPLTADKGDLRNLGWDQYPAYYQDITDTYIDAEGVQRTQYVPFSAYCPCTPD